MKNVKLFLALLLAGAAGQTALATETGDTLVLEKVNRVKIETRDTVQRIVISGMKDDPYFQYTQRISIPDTSAVRRKMSDLKGFNKVVVKTKDGKPNKWEASGHIYLGMGTMTAAPDGYSMWPTMELGIGITADYHPFGPKNTWSIGLLFGAVMPHTSSHRYWVKDGLAGDEMLLVPYPDDQEKTYSSLTAARFSVPVLYKHCFDQRGRWSLTLGAFVNFNFAANASRHFTIGDEDYDISLHHIGVRPVTVEPIVMFNAPYIPAIYCKYSPMTFFKDGRGPKMRQLTFGFYF